MTTHVPQFIELSVRELITELSEAEQAIRMTRRPVDDVDVGREVTDDVADLIRFERQIVQELRWRRRRARHLGGLSERARQAAM